MLSNKTKQPPHLIFLVFSAIFTILLFTRIGTFLATCLCLLFPAYETFKALETEETEDDARLLMFWVVFGFFYFCDQMLSWVFSFIPLYHIFRMILIMYIFLPQFNGCDKLYHWIVYPALSKYQDKIQKIVEPFELLAKRFSETTKLQKQEW